jgi:hypothetical protein
MNTIYTSAISNTSIFIGDDGRAIIGQEPCWADSWVLGTQESQAIGPENYQAWVDAWDQGKLEVEYPGWSY